MLFQTPFPLQTILKCYPFILFYEGNSAQKTNIFEVNTWLTWRNNAVTGMLKSNKNKNSN